MVFAILLVCVLHFPHSNENLLEHASEFSAALDLAREARATILVVAHVVLRDGTTLARQVELSSPQTAQRIVLVRNLPVQVLDLGRKVDL